MALLPWHVPFAVPTDTVLGTWREAAGPEPVLRLRDMVLAASGAEHDDHDYRAVQVGDLRLRHGNHPLLFRLFAEISRHQRLDHVTLQIFLEALLDNRRRHMPRAKARQPRHLLIFQNDFFHLASNFIGRYFHRDLAFDAVFVLRVQCLSGTHVGPFGLPCSHAVHVECKD